MDHRTCTHPGCDKKLYCKGMCRSHHSRSARAARLADTRRTCATPDCTAPGTAGRGWCEKHYRRYQRHGDPLATSRVVGDDLARFWGYVDLDGANGCWNWTGATSKDGYGIMVVAQVTNYMPRYSWELHRGPITDDMEPDHLCRNRACVNPDHLEPVTHRVNVLRGESPTAINARKTHCRRGHEFDSENTYITPSTGGRNCRTCLEMHAANRRCRAA